MFHDTTTTPTPSYASWTKDKKCWTKWYNHDNPDNNGDYETLSKLRHENPMEICDVPIQIEARTLSGESVASTGETIHK